LNQALETIERNARLQTQLVEDLLDVSRIIRGKLKLNINSVNLIDPIKAAIETVRLSAQAKAIQLHYSEQSSTILVSGDTNRLQQIAWNLLTNAIKFTLNGGKVDIWVDTLDSQARFRVSDTGKGISPDFLPHVFEHFRQADGSITRSQSGLGLGLAIVRHLVELHGGSVSAESLGEGKGATFTVLLPLQHRNEALGVNQSKGTLNLTLEEQQSLLKDIRALVVDDDADNREFLAFLLTQSGATVTAVASVNAGLAVLEQTSLDVLLSDIGMPDQDGYALMRELKKRSPKSPIPAIALTAYAREEDIQRALSSGFHVHLAKPIEPLELVTTVAQLVKGLPNRLVGK
jgi:CheY-like chemotaxis protein/two-component sensor histidine kinase